jgi:hypothetical protein
MKKRFIVLVEKSSEEQDHSFLEWAKSEKIGWWHWFQHAWLLSNSRGNLTASAIRDKLCDIYGTANTLVIELKGTDDTWSGFGPKNENKDMFKWIKDTWRKQ